MATTSTNLSNLFEAGYRLRAQWHLSGTRRRMWGDGFDGFYATVALVIIAMVLPTCGLWPGTPVAESPKFLRTQ
jgi:hypothetical protein